MKKELIKSISENARLNLTDKETKKFLEQISEVISAFSKLQKVNVKNVLPSFHPIKLVKRLREDKKEPSLNQEEALSNSRHKKDFYFKGPKVI